MPSQAVLELLVALKDQASSGLSTIGGALNSLGGVALGVAAAGVGAFGAALVSGIGDAREAAQIMGQTEAVIRSTGGAAGFTADQIAEMAGQLSAASGKSLFGDSDIQQGQNLLLTFTNIKETLPDATSVMVDMAQAMGTDVKGGAIQLGKALNDPIAGISALSRVGVTFSEEQKAVIKSLQESGDVAGAQRVILAELNKEFGGSAQAAATADGGWAQFNDRLGEAKETLGAAVLPLLNGLAGLLNDQVMPVLESGAAAFGGLVAAFQTGAEADGIIGGLSNALYSLGGVSPIFDALGDAVAVLPDEFARLESAVRPVIDGFQSGGLGGALAALPGVIGPVLGGVTDLRSRLALLAGDAVGGLIDRLADGRGFQSFLSNLGLSDSAVSAITGTIHSLGTGVREGAGLIADLGKQMSDLAGPLLEAGRGFGEMLMPHIATLSDFAATKLLPAIRDIVNWLGPQLQGAIKVVGPLLTGLVDLGLSIVELALKAIAAAWDTALKPAFESLSKWLGDLTGGWDQIARGAEKVGKLFSDVAQAIRDIASGNVGFDQIVRGWNSLFGGGQPQPVPGFAGGVNNFAGGLAVVGERGPELLRLPGGSDVIPAGRFGGFGGGQSVIINLTVQGSVLTEGDLVNRIQQGLIRKGQNNPNGALGGYG